MTFRVSRDAVLFMWIRLCMRCSEDLCASRSLYSTGTSPPSAECKGGLLHTQLCTRSYKEASSTELCVKRLLTILCPT